MLTRNKIYAIVEGHGEANRPTQSGQPAVIVLLNKLVQTMQPQLFFAAEKLPPFRLTYSEFFTNSGKFENAIRLHTKYPDCVALLVLLDMDDHCPKEKAFSLTDRVRSLGALPFSVVVVCAKCEYETWFLASLESIQPLKRYVGEPEARRDAKGWLKKEFGYRPVRDQAIYTRRLDIELARRRSRSFRRLYHAIEEIILAETAGQHIVTPQGRP